MVRSTIHRLPPSQLVLVSCDEARVIYLIDKGADVNARNEIGVSPLSFASCSPYPKILESLLSAGADINAQDNEGRTALMTTMGYPDTTEQFIEAGADGNLQDKKGRTALDYAMKIDTFRKEILKILLQAGATSGRRQANTARNRTRH